MGRPPRQQRLWGKQTQQWPRGDDPPCLLPPGALWGEAKAPGGGICSAREAKEPGGSICVGGAAGARMGRQCGWWAKPMDRTARGARWIQRCSAFLRTSPEIRSR